MPRERRQSKERSDATACDTAHWYLLVVIMNNTFDNSLLRRKGFDLLIVATILYLELDVTLC